jgi:cell division septation protein DedD
LSGTRFGNPGEGPAFRQPTENRTRTIRHQKILIALEREAGTAAVRRYRPSRPWPVGGLALAAAAAAVLATGGLSSVLDGGPDPAFAARIARSVASGPSPIEARAAPPPAAPAASVPAASEPAPPAAAWQIQVGAFRNVVAAEAHLRSLESGVPELARLTATHRLRGGLNRVRIGGIADETAARGLCARIVAAGNGCFVVAPES